MKKQISIPIVIVIILTLVLPTSLAFANGGFLLWQVGISDGSGVNPIDGADEYPANRVFYDSFDYAVPPGTTEYPAMPGYIGPANVCDFAGGRPCTDTTALLNLNFDLECNYNNTGELLFYYDRYGSEYDELYFDLVLDDEYFARIAAEENNFGSYTFDMYDEVGSIEKGAHTIAIKYAGGGSGNGHYIDYMKLVSMIDPEACNQPPVAEANGPYVVAVGQSIDLDHTGSYDPDGDSLSYEWDVTGSPFGTTTDETFVAGNEAGITEVTLTVDDSWGGTATDTAMVVVYDPSGGFVTGGGWIDSPAGAYKEATIVQYGNLTLDSPWWNTSFPEVWDLTTCDLEVSYGLDLSGMSPGHVPIEVGLKELMAPNIDPNGQGGWMQANPQAAGSTNLNLLDDDDHFLLVDHGWLSNELHYDVYPDGSIAASPFGTYNNVGFWFDRDGVDQWQATQWDMSQNGIAYNTGGLYTVSIDYSYVDPDMKGTMFATINYGQQGIYTGGWKNAEPEIFPAGKTFGLANGDFSQLQLFVGGGNVSGQVAITDLTITGCLNTTGKATFGFVSKYKKGADVPTGNTEFQFKAGDLNFHSTSYDWLVVTGSNYAKFKGTGSINGEGTYKFQIWAGDGTGDNGKDTFRIKIWYEDGDSEVVVYDNGMDQEIGGGSIVVHTK